MNEQSDISTYNEHSPISSGVHGPNLITAVAPRAPHIRRNSNLDVIFITIKENLSRKCIAISLIEPLQITGKTRKNRISKIQMNWKKKLVDKTLYE